MITSELVSPCAWIVAVELTRDREALLKGDLPFFAVVQNRTQDAPVGFELALQAVEHLVMLHVGRKDRVHDEEFVAGVSQRRVEVTAGHAHERRFVAFAMELRHVMGEVVEHE